MEDFNDWSIDDIETRYGYGDCAVFAVALSKIFKFPIVEFYEKDELFHVALVLEGTIQKNDLFLDVFGLSTAQQIKRRYGTGNKITIESKTEQELHKMSLFDNNDVEEAVSALNSLIQKGNFPEEQFIQELAIKNKHRHDKKIKPGKV